MKRAHVPVLLALCLLLAPVAAGAEDYSSSLGFRARVPDSWLLLTREELAENPDLFAALDLPGADPAFVEGIKARISSGQVEFLFRLLDDPGGFADNINLMKNVARLPRTEQELAETCGQFPAALSASAGRTLELHACELRDVNGRSAFYSDFDGIVEGSRSAQYQIQRSPSVVLIVTATARADRFEPVSTVLDAFVHSIEFESSGGPDS